MFDAKCIDFLMETWLNFFSWEYDIACRASHPHNIIHFVRKRKFPLSATSLHRLPVVIGNVFVTPTDVNVFKLFTIGKRVRPWAISQTDKKRWYRMPMLVRNDVCVQKNHKYRLKYQATLSFARAAHSFTCSKLLVTLARSAKLTHSLARSLRSFPRSWESEWSDSYFFCFFYFEP